MILTILFLVRSYLALEPTLLEQKDIHYVLTDKLNQDPLEQHFGREGLGSIYQTLSSSILVVKGQG